MVRCIRPIGNSSGLIIDKAILELFHLRAGSPVDVTLAPGGKGILLTPVAEDVPGEADHKARVRAAGEKVMDRHAGVFKKLAE